jgi:hypothetical protein
MSAAARSMSAATSSVSLAANSMLVYSANWNAGLWALKVK